MGYRPNISNIDIQGELFDTIKENLFKQRNIIVKKVIQISKDKSLFMIELKNKKFIRLDMINKRNKKKYTKENLNYRNLLYENNICIPSIIRSFIVNDREWVISEWIDGKRISEHWNSSEIFKKCGEEVAKINSIKDPITGYFLHIHDFSKINCILSKQGKVYFIDVLIYSYNVIDYTVVKLFLCLETINRINAFLDGYSKFRNTDRIINILEENDWTYRDFKFKQDNIKLD
jgi:hypothetical protein